MSDFSVVGRSLSRLEGESKVLGDIRYAADLKFHREASGAILFAKVPRARILSIRTDEAKALPGVLRVITAADIPGSNSLFGRFPVLADREIRYIGEALACVAAEDEKTAQEALKLIRVEYEVLPGIFSLDEAVEAKLPPVHQDRPDNVIENSVYPLYKGDYEYGLSQAELKHDSLYETPFAVNGYLEMDSLVAAPDPMTGGLLITGCIQNVYSIRSSVSEALGWPLSRIRVAQSAIGGSFGGKNESSVALAVKAALLAQSTKRAVRLEYSRKDIFRAGVKRHPYRMNIRAGMKPDGEITCWKHEIGVLGGPYNNQAMFANWRASVHSAGPYRTPHIRTDIAAYYSNTPYAGAYRGFSAPQICFAVEGMIDELAHKAGIDPAEMRRRNFIRPGDALACGQTADPQKMVLPLEKMLDDVLCRAGYEEKKKEFRDFNASGDRFKKGLGLAATYRGCGLGGEGFDLAGALICIEQDGSVILRSDMVEMGQGLRTAHAQIAAEILGIEPEVITVMETDTGAVRDGGPTVASRGLSAGGMAVKLAAEELRRMILSSYSGIWGLSEKNLLMSDGQIRDADGTHTVSFRDGVFHLISKRGEGLSAQGWFNPGIAHIDPATGQGECYPSYLSGITLTEVLVDRYTGKVTVPRVTMAYEVGRAVNPDIVRSQIIGGYVQGLGYAVSEKFETGQGKVKTRGFGSYLMPGIGDVPEFDLVLFEEDRFTGPFGAKGIGEVGVELAAAGVGNALFNATGCRVRNLPMNMETLASLFFEEDREEYGV